MDVYFISFGKKENSTAQPIIPNTVQPVHMQLKDACSVRSPILESYQFYDGNYCYIPSWFRYYYVRERTYINGAWTYELECDYLATFKTHIGGSSFYVTRSASERNEKMIDSAFPLNGIYSVAGSSSNQALGKTFNEGSIVIGVLGNNGTGQTLYTLAPNNFQTLLSSLLVLGDNNVSWGDIPQGAKNSILNPFQYITSCRWYPFTFASSYGLTSFKAGLWDCNVACAKVNTPAPEQTVFSLMMSIPSHPQTSSRGKYVNLKPFTTLFMELPALGLFELDESVLYDYPYLRIRLMLDPYNGVGTWDGWGCDAEQNARAIVFKKDAQVGIDIPLSSQDNAYGNFLEGVMGAVATVAFGVANPLPKGASALAHGIGVGSKATASLEKALEGSTGGVKSTAYSRGTLQEMMNFKTFLRAIFRNQCEVDTVNKGRPLCAMKTLNTLSGYMEVMNASVSLPASDEEIAIVNRYLENGFYYE